ncbi:MAG: Gfo/Idh/MocA family oxidoreductase [Candidatus Poribacteria bacterium]|nr:Gfo/Idh/MocA family oxidoreductase [Candidatus Poribacteria bacterium]
MTKPIDATAVEKTTVFRVGIIGCGRMANTIEDEQIAKRKQRPYRGGLVLPYSHAAGYAAVEETQVVATCDVHEGRLQAFVQRWNLPRGYTDYREMIEKEALDIVSVATRPEQHAEQMVFVAEHGVKGVYAEKPLCMTLRETDAIREAFERNGVHLEYGPIYRHWAAYQQARMLAESGEFGAVKSVLGFEGKALEGHFIDLLLYLLGDPEPVSIQGTISKLYPTEGDTSGMKFVQDAPIRSATIQFDNGTTAYVAGTGVGREIELVCADGVIRVVNDGEAVQVRRRGAASGALDTVPVAQMEPQSGTIHKIRDLVQAIQTGTPGRSNLRVTLISQEIGFGIYESHLRGGVAVEPPMPNRDRWVSSW